LLIFQPLVVDLDGTLVHTDMLHESALRVLRDKPWALLHIPHWLYKGKAVLKKHLASQTGFDPASLPYNQELLNWLRQEKQQGRHLVLCTASDHAIADTIADHLQLFDEVIASDGNTNLAGHHKAEELVRRYGEGNFDYAGNSSADLAVWQQSRCAIVVNASSALQAKAAELCEIERIFPSPTLGFREIRQMFRVHQWLKNLLLFVPLLASHQLANANIWLSLLLAFFSFNLCASTVYIANDLLDLESDRSHPRKRKRPFASGVVPAYVGVILAPILLLISMTMAFYVNTAFLGWLSLYFVLTCAYSFGIKRLIMLDCLTLAMLYTLRIVAGTAAAGVAHSFWLLAFSVFLFLSLAFVKRYAELEIRLLNGNEKLHGRGYYTSDAPLIQALGVTSGYVSVLVLALYLNSDTILKLYRSPEFIWGAVPVTLYWISWMWIQAHRGNMHDDPLVFAVKDKASLLAGVMFAGVITIGALGLPW
jgi:4-hydroxybenzoate polyprenyltransferase/phosphoglycolate phosphatase-like HAD superfamily hydrolase